MEDLEFLKLVNEVCDHLRNISDNTYVLERVGMLENEAHQRILNINYEKVK